MSSVKVISTGAALVAALAFAIPGPAFAGGAPSKASAADSPLAALSGSQLSTAELSSARGGNSVTLFNSANTTTNTLNDTASSGGSLDGTINAGYMNGWGIASNTVSGGSGIFNQASNTGNLVQINQSMSIFINAQ